MSITLFKFSVRIWVNWCNWTKSKRGETILTVFSYPPIKTSSLNNCGKVETLYFLKNIWDSSFDKLISWYFKLYFLSNPLINAHYYINENAYYFNQLLSKAEKERNNDGKKFYIVLDRDLIKKFQ